MKTLVLAFLFVAGSARASGNSVGNGGKVLHCPNAPTRYETFDIFEGRELFQEKPLACSGTGYAACLHGILDPLRAKFPVTVKQLLGAIDRFADEALFLHGQTLAPVDDDGHLFLPPGCTLEQVAVETGGANLPPGKIYAVDGDLFARLGPEDQAAAVLHEVLQAEREPGIGQNTPLVRRVVMGYLSGAVGGMSEMAFADFYSRNKKTRYSVGRGDLSWLTFNDNFMSEGDPTSDYDEQGKLVRYRNRGAVFGSLFHGSLVASNYGSWEGSINDQPLDVVVTGFAFLFKRPVLLEMRTADWKRVLGTLMGVTRVDQAVLCAREFRPEPGEAYVAPTNGCWSWASFH